MKRIKNLLVIFLLAGILVSCKDQKTGIAIVVDTTSYEHAKVEIDDYANTLKSEGLKPYLLIKDYETPDVLRNELISLYQSETPIEGAVFIGDVPIALVMDAQHLTSAFKMDQKKYGMETANVPTDRFYDDFDLVFDYIKQDSTNSLKHYYSLNFESPQTIHCDIYSGRIKVPEVENKYEILKKYLRKVVKQHKVTNYVDEFFFFAGHGYNSESMVARIDEQFVLKQQFPNDPNFAFMDHSMKNPIKYYYMSELQRNDLDIGLLSHHGGEDTEYLNGAAKVDSYKEHIAEIKRYLRGEIYGAKGDKFEIKEIKAYFKEKYGIPASWFDGAFKPIVERHDSAYTANLDLTLKDFSYYTPNVRFAIFDACYNGSFHRDEYLAGAYIFDDGNTVAAQGNTVNSLQDKWPQEMIGLLSLGMRVGEWNRNLCYLETHIIGDPTFRFTSVDPSIDANQLSVNSKKSNRFWEKKLKSEYADVQVLALRRLYENNHNEISNLLLDTYKKSNYASVRTECLLLLSKVNDNNYTEILKLAMFDDHELTQRFAINMAGKKGGDELIPGIIKLSFVNVSERVEFNLERVIAFFDKEKLLAEFDEQAKVNNFNVYPEKVRKAIRKYLEGSDRRYNGALEAISDTSSSDKNKYFEIRGLRNSNYHEGVDEFLNFITTSSNQEHREMMLEALGWFTHSVEKQKIIDYCNALAENESEPEAIRKEARKTVIRLS